MNITKIEIIYKMLWLSYIIPMYNSEAYISICLDSILLQGLDEVEYEVIVVNDGSTDRSGEIVSRYCEEHSNFRLLNKENGGVSSARNVGIEEAKGEYIYFMDSDDRLLPKGMQIIRDCYLRRYPQTDMITFYSHTVDKHYEPKKWEHIHPHKLLFHGTFLEYGNQYGFGWSVCFRIISRCLIMENELRFKSYVIGQDELFVVQLFTNTDAMLTATNLDIYRYCVRRCSNMTRIDRKHLARAFNGFIEISKEVRLLEKVSPYKKEVFEKEIESFQRQAFTRLLSGAFSYKQIKVMLNKAKKDNFYPIADAKTKLQKFINIIIDYPAAIYMISVLFRYIFPYIKPWIRRN